MRTPWLLRISCGYGLCPAGPVYRRFHPRLAEPPTLLRLPYQPPRATPRRRRLRPRPVRTRPDAHGRRATPGGGAWNCGPSRRMCAGTANHRHGERWGPPTGAAAIGRAWPSEVTMGPTAGRRDRRPRGRRGFFAQRPAGRPQGGRGRGGSNQRRLGGRGHADGTSRGLSDRPNSQWEVTGDQGRAQRVWPGAGTVRSAAWGLRAARDCGFPPPARILLLLRPLTGSFPLCSSPPAAMPRRPPPAPLWPGGLRPSPRR